MKAGRCGPCWLAQAGWQWEPHAELLLMAAARVQHVRRVILPALAAGRIVLCDRFVGSSLAYQGGGRGIDPAFIRSLHKTTTGDLWPRLTILLDVDPAVGLQRSRNRLSAVADEGRFESLDLSFHQRVRACFRTLSEELPGWLLIDAAQTQVIEDAWLGVAQDLGNCRPPHYAQQTAALTSVVQRKLTLIPRDQHLRPTITEHGQHARPISTRSPRCRHRSPSGGTFVTHRLQEQERGADDVEHQRRKHRQTVRAPLCVAATSTRPRPEPGILRHVSKPPRLADASTSCPSFTPKYP